MTFQKISVVNSRVLWSFKVLCRLSVLLKDDFKISVSFKQIQDFKVVHFSMAKVKKVNIAVVLKPITC
jgi:hypothetical protein